MHNMAHRHRRAARKLGVKGPVKKAYVIQDSNHRPDLRGEFAGVKVARESGKDVVYLSDQAARFYLDSGSIKPQIEEPVAKEDLNEQRPAD